MAHEGLWEQLAKLDRHETTLRAKCQYLEKEDSYVVTMLNKAYRVNLSNMRIHASLSVSQQEPAAFLEQLCLLAYLINSQDLMQSNELVNAQGLPGGQFFFRGPHTLPTGKLMDAFGDCPERLYRASEQLAARESGFGDASITLDILPRVQLTIVIWRQCEEFDARASILFDKTVAEQLPLDALMAAVNLAVGTILQHVTEN